MKRRHRIFYSVVNLERGVLPAVYLGVNHVLPRIMRTAVGDGFELVEDVPYRVTDGGPLHLDVVKPEGTGPFPVLLGIHGGAWVLGRKENIRHAATYLARRGFMTVLINYRLAPTHRWPAPGEDVAAAMKWIKANARRYGGLGDRIGVFGDSAGGHLSAYGALKISGDPARASELPEVAAAVHWYGVFDMEKFTRVPWHRTRQIVEAVFGQERARDAVTWKQFSPRSYLDVATRLPPTLLFAAGGDPLYSQSIMYERELARRGAQVELRKYPRAIHGFLNVPFAPECRASLAHTARWFGEHLGGERGVGARRPMRMARAG